MVGEWFYSVRVRASGGEQAGVPCSRSAAGSRGNARPGHVELLVLPFFYGRLCRWPKRRVRRDPNWHNATNFGALLPHQGGSARSLKITPPSTWLREFQPTKMKNQPPQGFPIRGSDLVPRSGKSPCSAGFFVSGLHDVQSSGSQLHTVQVSG